MSLKGDQLVILLSVFFNNIDKRISFIAII